LKEEVVVANFYILKSSEVLVDKVISCVQTNLMPLFLMNGWGGEFEVMALYVALLTTGILDRMS